MKITHGGIENRRNVMAAGMEGEVMEGKLGQIVGKCGKCENGPAPPLTRLSPFYILARIGP